MTEIDWTTGELEVGDGLRLVYRDSGPRGGSAPPPLVVPAGSWLADDLAPRLAGAARIVAVDLRGRGRSSPVADESLLGIDRDVEDLERLRRHLDLERPSFLGWSYHGAVAARYARRHPECVRRLVLSAPTAPVAQPYFHGFLERFARRLDLGRVAGLQGRRPPESDRQAFGEWARALQRVYLEAYVVDPACLERMRSAPVVEPHLDPERANLEARRALERLGAYDWRDEFRDLTVPALLIHGERDPVMMEASELWASLLPDARLLRLPECGHLPWLERPEAFFPAVRGFLDGAWPDGAVRVPSRSRSRERSPEP